MWRTCPPSAPVGPRWQTRSGPRSWRLWAFRRRRCRSPFPRVASRRSPRRRLSAIVWAAGPACRRTSAYSSMIALENSRLESFTPGRIVSWSRSVVAQPRRAHVPVRTGGLSTQSDAEPIPRRRFMRLTHGKWGVPLAPPHSNRTEPGRAGRNRTRNLRFWRPLLYQLSYDPMSTFRRRRFTASRGEADDFGIARRTS